MSNEIFFFVWVREDCSKMELPNVKEEGVNESENVIGSGQPLTETKDEDIKKEEGNGEKGN